MDEMSKRSVAESGAKEEVRFGSSVVTYGVRRESGRGQSSFVFDR